MPAHKSTPSVDRKSLDSVPEHASFFVKEIFRTFRERTAKNPRYSLRAFSRSLGVSPSWLLRLLKSERSPSVSMVDAIAKKLAWPQTVRNLALRETASSTSARKLKTISDSENESEGGGTRWLADDDFLPIADLATFAILELPELPHFRLTPHSAAEELGIPIAKAQDAIDRLVANGNLTQDSDGTYRKSKSWVHTSGRDRTTAQHRTLVQELLTHAASHVAETPWGERLNYWGMYAIDPHEIPKVKPIIERFLIDIESVLGGRERKKIYTAGFYLCPAKTPGTEGA